MTMRRSSYEKCVLVIASWVVWNLSGAVLPAADHMVYLRWLVPPTMVRVSERKKELQEGEQAQVRVRRVSRVRGGGGSVGRDNCQRGRRTWVGLMRKRRRGKGPSRNVTGPTCMIMHQVS